LRIRHRTNKNTAHKPKRIKVREGALKKIAPSRGKRENFWGISCEKSRFYAKKSYFSNFNGCTRLAAASDKAYQLLAHGRWFSPGTPASSTTKSGRHDIAEILLNVELNTKRINQSINHF
jgi:hypothetical protein